MQFFWTEPFRRDYKHLPPEVQERTNHALRRFYENSRHPGLHVKKMEGIKDVWELRVSDNYRITFQFVREGVLLRRIGTHNVLKQP